MTQAEIDSFLIEWNNPDPYVRAHTSGSTGKPKVILLLKSDMRHSARATNAFFGINSLSVLSTPLSAAYIAGKMMIVRALEAGCRLLPMPASLELRLDGTPIDLLAIVPAQIPALLRDANIGSVKALLVGGAEIPPELKSLILKAGVKVFESYGMTETCSHVALRALGTESFEAMPGVSFKTGRNGNLLIEAAGYNWQELETRDVVKLLDSRHFIWRGRLDNVINSGGIKLYAEELEKEYAPAMDGREYYVAPESHSVWGQAVVLVVKGPEDKDLAARISVIVSSRKRRPKKIMFVAELPRTAGGKIIRTCSLSGEHFHSQS